MHRSFVFLAEGFEEIEALTVVDVMRRAGMDVKTVSVEISVFYAFEYHWDAVWLVTSDEAERKRRVMERDGVSANSADEIISSQKICSDYTVNIVNDGDFELLRRRVERAIAETLNR